MRCILSLLSTCHRIAGTSHPDAPSSFIMANGVTFHMLEAGTGPPLLLLHGGGLTLDLWRSLIAQAAGRFHIYAIDTRGHGQTNNPDQRFSYQLLAADAAAIITALNLDRPMVAGYSDGGTTALLLAVSHPGLLHAVIVAGATNQVATHPHHFAGLHDAFGTGRTGTITDADLDTFTLSRPEAARHLAHLHHRDNNPTHWRSLLKQLWPMWTTPLTITRDQLRTIKTPMLVLLADHDDFADVKDAVFLSEQIPTSQLAILPGATHSVFHDRPELFNTLVLDFLDAQTT